MSHTPRVAIIGAGMSGLSAASKLREAGVQVTLFDKSRGSGGRMSSKRTDFGTFDMGTQYFTARDPGFAAAAASWADAGLISTWQPRLFRYDEKGLIPSDDSQQRFVGTPRMTALSRGLLASSELVSGTRIERLERQAQQWHLVDSQQTLHGPYDQVIVAVPPAQAAPLLAGVANLVAPASNSSMEPGWAVAITLPQKLDSSADAVFVRSGPLDWIAREASKPGRANSENWVLQSTPAWAEAHLDDDPAQIVDALVAAMAEVLGLQIPTPVFQQAHRWLYARPAADCEWGALAAPEQGIYVCGDWCLGGRLEAAWVSGQQAAKAVLSAQ